MSDHSPPIALGAIGSLALSCIRRARVVVLVWCLLAAGLAAQVPRLHDELSGVGWEALGSESVKVRAAVEEDFDVPMTSVKVKVPDLGLLPTDASARTVFEPARTAFGPARWDPSR